MPQSIDVAPPQTITISKHLYNQLLAADRTLDALYAAGVDNWEGYHDACDEFDEDSDEVDEDSDEVDE